MDIHDKQDLKHVIGRIDQLLASGIFNNVGHVLYNSAFIELMICMRDLLFKVEKYSDKIDFSEDIIVNSYVKNIYDAITAFRDACCHINSFKNLFDDNGNRGSFNFCMGKANFMKIGDVELKSEYEDDLAIFFGSNRLYFKRHIIRAFEEAKQKLNPLIE